jgi:predicted DNA-binding transcriptional regulator AlpA
MKEPTTTPDPLIRTRRLSEITGASVATLERWRQTWATERKGPAFIKLSDKLVVYPMSSVTEWIERRRAETERSLAGAA